MKTVAVTVALFVTAFMAPALADEQLAKEKACTACHAVGKKLVGPDYAEVAKKYKGDKGAQDKLVQSIVKGSQGQYGPVPMPPNKVTEDEARRLAAWILSR